MINIQTKFISANLFVSAWNSMNLFCQRSMLAVKEMFSSTLLFSELPGFCAQVQTLQWTLRCAVNLGDPFL